jgi:hypothetical protein
MTAVSSSRVMRLMSRAARILACGALGIVFPLGCSPDLQEVVGPLVPVPNVTGQVIRHGIPADDIKVKLEITETDSTVTDARTDAQGGFAFAEVGAGNWTVRADSREPSDFAKVTYDFVFLGPDTSLEVPPLEISLDGLRPLTPENEAILPVPSFTSPIRFVWQRPEDPTAAVQVRVFGPTGEAFWYSERIFEEFVPWNGFGNRGEFIGKKAEPGTYHWRLRVERSGSSIEWSTGNRTIVFTEETP